MKLALIALLLPSAFAAVKKTAANAKETAFLEEYAAASSPYTPMYAIDAKITQVRRGRGHPGHGQRPHVPRPQGRLRRLAGVGDALLVPLRGPHGDELPVGQDLRLVVC